MRHIEKSGFHRGEYTALAGTAETLTRYRIYKRDTVWIAVPLIQSTRTRDPDKSTLTCDTLRELDAEFVSLSA